MQFLSGDGEKGVYSELAGDLSARGPTHAVADDVEAEIGVHAEAVLIIGAYAANVRGCDGFYVQPQERVPLL
jgi:hypothetical protein